MHVRVVKIMKINQRNYLFDGFEISEVEASEVHNSAVLWIVTVILLVISYTTSKCKK